MIRAAVIVAAVLLITGPAFAACSGPAGEESIIIYNHDHKTMQFCDGTTWWTMKGGGLWFKSGSEIYYNSGNAGIGTTTPGTALEVGGGITVTTCYDGQFDR